MSMFNQLTAQQILQDTFRFTTFRGDQEAVIAATLAGENSLVLMPTGMGKSLCYQIPALMREGLTVVISPLIALMQDQVAAAQKRSIRCAYINSSLERGEREQRYRQLAEGKYQLIYVTPERFRKQEFLQSLAVNKVWLLAVDEAHCISQWGHDFRPDYTRIAEFRQHMGEPTTIALTATATPDVQADIAQQLGLVQKLRIFNGGMQRHNLALRFEAVHGLDEKLRLFIAHRHQVTGPVVVYFSLIDTLEKFSREIRRMGIDHLCYHGNMESGARKKVLRDFLAAETGTILATPAFGLGIDKPNIRAVVHAEVPGSIEAYFQEVGRAGRDGLNAEGLLLYDGDDVAIQMDFLRWAHPDPGFISTVLRKIATDRDRVLAEGMDGLRQHLNFYNSRDFRLETALNLLERWGCIEGGFAKRDLKAVGELPATASDQAVYGLRLKAQQERLYRMVQLAQTSDCRLLTVYRYFGMESASDCGRCDCCQVKSVKKELL